MEWLTEPFDLAFQQRALVGGALVAVTSSVVGTWVIIRGMTFLGDALVHGVIPGIALALEVIVHFSRKPLFAYKWAVGGILGVSAMSMIVWAHHMFTSGMSDSLRPFFLTTTELI